MTDKWIVLLDSGYDTPEAFGPVESEDACYAVAAALSQEANDWTPIQLKEPPISTTTNACPECNGALEMRGNRRCYMPLDASGVFDSWSEGDMDIDRDDDGRELLYCLRCDAEWAVLDVDDDERDPRTRTYRVARAERKARA